MMRVGDLYTPADSVWVGVIVGEIVGETPPTRGKRPVKIAALLKAGLYFTYAHTRWNDQRLAR